MKHPQVSRPARRERQKEQLTGPASTGLLEDPQLRSMLASHIHCGQEMQLVNMLSALPGEQTAGKNEGRLLTYRCACGFKFDSTPGRSGPEPENRGHQ